MRNDPRCEICRRMKLATNPGPCCAECRLLLRNGDVEREVWRPIPSCPGYEASSKGAVRFRRTRRPLTVNRTHRYPRVTIRGRQMSVHALVAEAFLGPRPDGAVVCHLDDDPDHADIGNLAYGSPAENAADARRNRERRSQ